MPLNQEQVLAALKTVNDPELYKDIVTLGMVKRIQVAEAGGVVVALQVNSPSSAKVLDRDITAALRAIGATAIKVEMNHPSQPPGTARLLPQVKSVIAVGAGKGGVGKSTLAVNLAVGLQRTGAAVGLMDGDIYGPSMPTMLGIKGQQPQVNGPKIIPFHVHGIHAITIGALVEQDKPLIWRGPMAHGAFKQLFSDNTQWPELDYLIVDLPPGTGDVPLTLCQL
jgi:ATP-binding protein involved in chromosome partitioning